MSLKLKIEHNTEYSFSKPVFLEPHLFRFKPRTSPYVSLESFSLSIDPKPEGMNIMLSEEGNHVYQAWFSGSTDHLTLKAESIVTTIHHNPFEFLVSPPKANDLPLVLEPKQRQLLAPYLEPIDASGTTKSLAKHLLEKSERHTLPMCSALTGHIFQNFEWENRDEGPPLEPAETFKIKKGSCRDLAYLAMAVLREVNLPCRFVSGYHFDPVNEDHELHAWVEVFIPGGGWKAFDPSIGLAVVEHHIPVASSALVSETMPVTATFRGEAESTLKSWVDIAASR